MGKMVAGSGVRHAWVLKKWRGGGLAVGGGMDGFGWKGGQWNLINRKSKYNSASWISGIHPQTSRIEAKPQSPHVFAVRYLTFEASCARWASLSTKASAIS